MATVTVNNAGRTPDYYRVLGVPHSADYHEIDAAYWQMSRGADGGHMNELNEAYEALNNKARRSAYDARWEETAGPAEEVRAEPSSAPPEPEPAPQPVDRAEADLDTEEPDPEAASAPPEPASPEAEPEPWAPQDEPGGTERAEAEPWTPPEKPADAGLAGRLGWPPV